MMIRPLKILLSAYACEPNRGSEQGVGWNFLINIARFHKVHVILAKWAEISILNYKKNNPEITKNITFHFIQLPPSNRTIKKLFPPISYTYYHEWQKKAFEYAIELEKKENFDLIHHITIAGYREPGYLWKLNKPFIWGPLGGLNQTSWKLLPMLGLHGMLFYGVRNILNAWQKRFRKRVRLAANVASTILVSDRAGMHTVKTLWKKKPIYMCEVGCPSIRSINDLPKHNQKEPLHVCWAGLFIPRKALQLLLEALALVKHPIYVHILGNGKLETTWKNLSNKLNISSKVKFHGSIPHDKVLEIMSTCHAMCITSIHEGGTGTVTLEALQNGLPIIALDHCAFSEVITDSCGIKIPIISKKQIIQDFARHLDTLASNEKLRFKLSQGALERAKDFTWEQKFQQLNSIYYSAINKN